MTDAVARLMSQVLSLSSSEREELACALLSSLEPDEAAVCAARDAEIAARVAEIRGGTAQGRPAEVVLAELRTLYP